MSDIDRYLDRLLAELRGSPADVRRVLTEAEEHLREAARDGVEEGLTEEEAQRRAVERFGPPRVVARRFDGVLRSGEVVRALAWALAPLAAVGLIAVGVSGVISEVLGRLFGPAFVSGDLPWVRYTPQRCAELRGLFPGHDCLEAATLDHWGEVVWFRVAAGALGLLILGAYALVRRRAKPPALVLRPGLVPAAGAAVYGLAAMVLALQGADAAALGGTRGGGGQWWSAGIVALAAAVAYLRSASRVVFSRSTT
ncbi:permease prefix domain 1-containing protein [Actinomadura sp. DC4]|uniref:HAAS signaling domain-containing protein n=1 Tax=Actinomadura sp. DC4 TaxID=3055069 RepID=UPI0025B17D88|nr:permease prefix domain 1-containing protein [Actinomadura sp. DC4]MDN3355867.1 permease prefix domain 1-containing protein [Actinomadura sp. DC4]